MGMFTLIKLSVIIVIDFVYLSLFKIAKIKKLPERERVIKAREIIKQLSEKAIKLAKVDLQVRYLDYEAYKSLDFERGVVVVSNHESNFDIPVILAGLDIPVGFVAKKEMEKWPFYSEWMRLSKCVFLNRTNPREGIKNIKEAMENIKQGYNMVIFPEGERSLDGNVGRFKKGSFKMVTEGKNVILPLTVDGTFFIQRKGEKTVHSNKKVVLTVGKPLEIDGLSMEETAELSIKIYNLIKEQKNIKK